jgi:hypothetical protein
MYSKVLEHFNFLSREYEFHYSGSYQFTYEKYEIFTKKEIVVFVVFDGVYWCSLYKVKKVIINYDNENLITSINLIKPIKYNLGKLDKDKELYNSFLDINIRHRSLVYYSTLLKNNPEILDGDFRKFSFWYRLKQKFGFFKK